LAAGGYEVALGLGEVVGEEFEDGAEGWGFLEVEAEGGGVEADEVGLAEEDAEAEVALVEAGGGAEVSDLKDDLGGCGHGGTVDAGYRESNGFGGIVESGSKVPNFGAY
jgi:hypothetical protein